MLQFSDFVFEFVDSWKHRFRHHLWCLFGVGNRWLTHIIFWLQL